MVRYCGVVLLLGFVVIQAIMETGLIIKQPLTPPNLQGLETRNPRFDPSNLVSRTALPTSVPFYVSGRPTPVPSIYPTISHTFRPSMEPTYLPTYLQGKPTPQPSAVRTTSRSTPHPTLRPTYRPTYIKPTYLNETLLKSGNSTFVGDLFGLLSSIALIILMGCFFLGFVLFVFVQQEERAANEQREPTIPALPLILLLPALIYGDPQEERPPRRPYYNEGVNPMHN